MGDDPVVGPAFDAIGALVVEAFVVALEDASVPKVSVSARSHPHFASLLLQLGLQSVE